MTIRPFALRFSLLVAATALGAACSQSSGPGSQPAARDAASVADAAAGAPPATGNTDGASSPVGAADLAVPPTPSRDLGAPPVVVPSGGNPYAGAAMYLNPDYAREVDSSIAQDPTDAALLGKMKSYSTAIWIDTIAKVPSIARYLDDAARQQAAAGKPVVTTFVIYDLPNRDCAANASNGELTVDQGGLAIYKSQYIDAIAAIFRAHSGQPIVGIVEPDSLPNIATNLSIPKCAASESAYRDGVAYAIATLSQPHVSLYVDAAHAGWLGWPDNMTRIATIFRDVLAAAGGASKVRGFATDTANYSVLHEVPELFDYQYNPCHDELTYVQKLGVALGAVGLSNARFLIDTSRDGLGGIRAQWGSWCNVHGAGLGQRPVADPVAGVDAYCWVKPPGESDGTSDPQAPRFDSSCANPDATPGAPQAGQWFHSYFVNLVKNANPPL